MADAVRDTKGSWAATSLKYRPHSAPVDSLDAPEWMPEKLRPAFAELVKLLSESGTLEALDLHSVARLVMYRHQWDRGDIELKIKLEPMIVRIEKLFGLSPSARKNVVRGDKSKQVSDDGRKNRYF